MNNQERISVTPMKLAILCMMGICVLMLGHDAHAQCCAAAASAADESGAEPGKGVYAFTVKDIDGNEVSLNKYTGKAALIVNVASRCGLTPQYAGLVELYNKYKDQGFVILAFPSNDFNKQEPGTNAEIKEFCSTKFQVTFPLFDKISVKGEEKAPLYAYLTGEETNPDFPGEVEWNFGKFLVNQKGEIVGRFGPATSPTDETVVSAIESLLKAEGDAACTKDAAEDGKV